MIEIIFAFILSYLIGSINPAFLFGKMKGIDIRTAGDKNPGTRNIKKVLGVKYAIPTAIFDVFKSLIGIGIGTLFQLDFLLIQICGIWAIIGHNFPFYMGFRGGQGSAAFMGILLYYMLRYLRDGLQLLLVIILFTGLWFLFHYITMRAEMMGLVLMPPFVYAMFQVYPDNPYNVPLAILMGYIMIIYAIFLVKNHLFVTQLIKDEGFQNHHWRVLARPITVLYGIFYLFFPQGTLLVLSGIPAAILLIMDLIRLHHKKGAELLTVKVTVLYRKNEERKISTMTYFIWGVFFSVLIFQKEVAIVVIVFLTFGDLFGKLFGMAYGRHAFFKKKTYEGSMAYFGCSVICGYFLATILSLPLWVIIIGALCATFVEALPLPIDDNFTVPLVSGSIITLFLFIFY